MRAGQAVNGWARAWGLTFFSLGIFHLFPAQAQQVAPTAKADPKHHHYKLVDVGTLGGPNSAFNIASNFNAGARGLNSRGTGAGFADTPTPDPNLFLDCCVNHGFMWEDGVTTDLGTLPGGTNSYAYWISDRGLIAGQSQTGLFDPLTGYPEFAAVLWNERQIVNLGTLGGNQSIAYAINNHGQVVGGALNTAFDPFAGSPLPNADSLGSFAQNFLFTPAVTQTRAFLWQDGAMRDLGTLGGPDSAAELVNDRGQIAGVSFTSSTPNAGGVPTMDPFFWDEGKMVDIGTLGGTFGFPEWLNDRGQVVGQSNVAGDNSYHAFLWDKKEGLKDLGTLGGTFGAATRINDTGEVVGWANNAGDQAVLAFHWKKGVMTNLGTVSGDTCSQAFGINSEGQVVGSSHDCGEYLHAFLWEDGGPIVDLNTLISPAPGLTVREGDEINDRGEIAGKAMLSNGDVHAVLLVPCDENHPNIEGCDYSSVDAKAAAGAVPGVTKHQVLAGQNSSRLPQSGLQAGTVTLSPTQMYFACHFGVGGGGGIIIPNPCGPQTATLRNAGATPVYLQAITVSGQYFPEKNSCPLAPTALQPGQSCAITVSLNTRVGRGCGSCRVTRTGTLDVYDTASGNPQSIALTGFISVN
jgi:probable HAF family extracellular repeat protein